jgi:hypothetical protein
MDITDGPELQNLKTGDKSRYVISTASFQHMSNADHLACRAGIDSSSIFGIGRGWKHKLLTDGIGTHGYGHLAGALELQLAVALVVVILTVLLHLKI